MDLTTHRLVRRGSALAILALGMVAVSGTDAIARGMGQPDTTLPTATLNQAVGQPDPTATGPILFTLVFSEPVIGLENSEVTVTGTAGATSAVISGPGPEYTVTVSNMTQYGSVVVQLFGGVVTDVAGNPNLSASFTDRVVDFAPPPDTIRPTVTVNQAVGQVDPASASPIRFTVTFSEQVFGFSSTDLTVVSTAGPVTAAITGGSPIYTVSVSGMNMNGTVSLSIAEGRAADAAGNTNFPSTSTDNTVTYTAGGDTTPPTVTVNQAVGQADPTVTSPVLFTVTFSELVSGFSLGDLSLGGSAGATSTAISGTGPTYTVAVSGMTTSGTVTLAIPAGVLTDAAGNPNQASTSSDNVVTFTSTTVLMPPTAFETMTVVGTTATFRWQAPVSGPNPTGYLLEGGTTPGSVLGTVATGALPQLTLPLPAGTFYVRLRSLGPGGPSAPSNEIQVFAGVPAAPSAPVQLLGAANGSALELSWRNTFAGGTPTSVAIDVTGAVNATLPLGLVEQFSFNGVPPGSYTFRVRALNGATSSAASAPVTLSFPGACTLAPGPPTNMLAWSESGMVHMRWDPPATGTAATWYVLSVSGAYVGSFDLGPARSLSSPAPPGVYALSVRAYNSCGPSQATTYNVVVP